MTKRERETTACSLLPLISSLTSYFGRLEEILLHYLHTDSSGKNVISTSDPYGSNLPCYQCSYKSGFGETSIAPCSKCAVRSTRSMFYPVHARNVQVCCA